MYIFLSSSIDFLWLVVVLEVQTDYRPTISFFIKNYMGYFSEIYVSSIIFMRPQARLSIYPSQKPIHGLPTCQSYNYQTEDHSLLILFLQVTLLHDSMSWFSMEVSACRYESGTYGYASILIRQYVKREIFLYIIMNLWGRYSSIRGRRNWGRPRCTRRQIFHKVLPFTIIA